MAVRAGKTVKPYAATKIYLLINIPPEGGEQIVSCFSSVQDCVTQANAMELTNTKALECKVENVHFFEKAEGSYAEKASIAQQATKPCVEKKQPRSSRSVSGRGKQQPKKANKVSSGNGANRKVRRASTSANRKKGKT